jgi:DNA replication ATP-dependent helicase Dna2
MKTEDNVSRIAYLTVYAKRFLEGLQPPVSDLDELTNLLTDDQRVGLLDDCASLRGEAAHLAHQVDALKTGERHLVDRSSLAMPAGEHVRLILTLQDEPVSHQIYTFGLYAQGLRDVLEVSPMTLVRVAPDSDSRTCESLERELVTTLFDLLKRVDAYNQDQGDDWSSKKTLQTYVFDSYERDLLTDLLIRRILDPEVAQEALQVFFHFQRPELIEAETHPQSESFFPVVVLTSVIRSLFALPIDTTYSFAEVVQELSPETNPFVYRRDDFFDMELSNELVSRPIFYVWNEGRTDFIDSIEKRVRARLWATNATVQGLRDAVKGTNTLFAWPERFRLPEDLGMRHPLLSRLAFINSYESMVGYLQTRQARTAPIEEAYASGNAIELRSTGDGSFEIHPRHRDAAIEPSNFFGWIFTAKTPAGERARLRYDDYIYRNKPYAPKNSPVALARIRSLETDQTGDARSVHLELRTRGVATGPKAGSGYIISRRFTDYTSDKAAKELKALDAELEPALLEMVTDPSTFSHSATQLPGGVRETAVRLAAKAGMTASQLAAFNRVCDNRLQLVWGPPGTGKTHFLALAILCLTESHRLHDLPYQVIVTAFTHPAIDNCLKKIADLSASTKLGGSDLRICKLQVAANHERVQTVESARSSAWAHESQRSIIGSTVWQMTHLELDVADLLVIDEASQLRLPESAIATRRVKRAGRLVMAGDDLQLAPIVQGTYPEPDDGEPILHRSIFECLRLREGSQSFTATLLENFRMNHVLCEYPRNQIYVDEYDSFDEFIGSRRITLHPLTPPSQMVEEIVDPGYPLVVGLLEGVRATAENIIEARITSSICCFLREALLAQNAEPYPDTPLGDSAFWSQGLFIVSPHHAQIRAVKRALQEERAWASSQFFVDTVDKMQGQECDAVIATYGVSDVEYAMNEKEFIYSLNRLNVSITRARAKTIVLLPRPLIQPPIHAFEDERTSDGISFMQGLVRFAEQAGTSSTHSVDDGPATLTLLRVPADRYNRRQRD